MLPHILSVLYQRNVRKRDGCCEGFFGEGRHCGEGTVYTQDYAHW